MPRLFPLPHDGYIPLGSYLISHNLQAIQAPHLSKSLSMFTLPAGYLFEPNVPRSIFPEPLASANSQVNGNSMSRYASDRQVGGRNHCVEPFEKP
jgi:hypothetical protein